MGLDLKNELEQNQMIVVVIENKDYARSIAIIAKQLSTSFKNIAYVSLNKPYNTLLQMFEKNNIPKNKFRCIDTMTAATASEQSAAKDRCIFISDPRAFTEISIALGKMSADQKIDVALVDSLSTLLIYEDEKSVIKFIHSLTAKLRALDEKSVLTVLKGDVSDTLLKDLSMFVDKIITVEGKEYL